MMARASMSWRLKVSFASLLALTVGFKVAAGNWQATADPGLAQMQAKQQIAGFFSRYGFIVSAPGDRPDSPFLSAVHGDCHLFAVASSPEGWHGQITRSLAEPGDQVIYVYDGVAHRQPPSWGPWIDDAWLRAARAIHAEASVRLLIGIVAAPACDLAQLPWPEIARALPQIVRNSSALR